MPPPSRTRATFLASSMFSLPLLYRRRDRLAPSYDAKHDEPGDQTKPEATQGFRGPGGETAPPGHCVAGCRGDPVWPMPAELVEAGEQDVAAHPQHREGADHRDGVQNLRHRRDQAPAEAGDRGLVGGDEP